MKNSGTFPLLLWFFLLPSVAVLGSESSPPPSLSPLGQILVGSSLSNAPNNGSSYWLSPSQNFAFGFYSGRNTIGIWIHKSRNKSLIWTANLDDYRVNYDSSISFDDDGVIALHQPGIIRKPIFSEIRQPASHALVTDNGNFVIYNSMSYVIWQSFDHPSDTIVSGQSLKSGSQLLSPGSSSKLNLANGKMILRGLYDITWETRHYKEGKPVSLNFDSSGDIYLLDGDGLVTKNLTNGEWQHGFSEFGNGLYRATLGSDGVLRVYWERLGDEDGESIELWHSICYECRYIAWQVLMEFIWSAIVFYIIGALTLCCRGRLARPISGVCLSLGFVFVVVMIFQYYIHFRN